MKGSTCVHNLPFFHHQPIFLEPKEAGELPLLQKNYSAKIHEEGGNGACLVGVMSGKVKYIFEFSWYDVTSGLCICLTHRSHYDAILVLLLQGV